jgi:polyferredoxin
MINLAAVIGAAILGAFIGSSLTYVYEEHKRHMHELRKAAPTIRKTAYKLGAVLMVLVIGGFTIWTGVFG